MRVSIELGSRAYAPRLHAWWICQNIIGAYLDHYHAQQNLLIARSVRTRGRFQLGGFHPRKGQEQMKRRHNVVRSLQPLPFLDSYMTRTHNSNITPNFLRRKPLAQFSRCDKENEHCTRGTVPVLSIRRPRKAVRRLEPIEIGRWSDEFAARKCGGHKEDQRPHGSSFTRAASSLVLVLISDQWLKIPTRTLTVVYGLRSV